MFRVNNIDTRTATLTVSRGVEGRRSVVFIVNLPVIVVHIVRTLEHTK